jgi:hypothetical protein
VRQDHIHKRWWRLVTMDGLNYPVHLETVLDSALLGLHSFAGDNPLKYRARRESLMPQDNTVIGSYLK